MSSLIAVERAARIVPMVHAGGQRCSGRAHAGEHVERKVMIDRGHALQIVLQRRTPGLR